jgi:hypothetical protein
MWARVDGTRVESRATDAGWDRIFFALFKFRSFDDVHGAPNTQISALQRKILVYHKQLR